MSWRSRRYRPVPHLLPLSYQAHLPRLNSETLKRIARLWVGTEANKMNKEACVRSVIAMLQDDTAVRSLVERLSDFARAGLGLLKLRGQSAPTEVLALELLMSGLPFESGNWSYRYSYGGDDYYAALNRFLESGVALLRDRDTMSGYSLTVSKYNHGPEIFSDQRILSHVRILPPATLNLRPVSVAAGLSKSPAEVLFRFVSLSEAIRKHGRIEFTTKGRPTKTYLYRLVKTLGWNESATGPAPLPDAPLFFLRLLITAGLLRSSEQDFRWKSLDPSITRFLESPYEIQAAAWRDAYRSLTGWVECKLSSVWLADEELLGIGKFNGMRTALLLALGALPTPGAWYRVSDLSAAIFDRLGERFSLGYVHYFYTDHKATAAQVAQKRQQWRQEIYARWREQEQLWIEHAIAGPLFHLGWVEVGFEPGKGEKAGMVFRLTDLGTTVLYDLYRPGQAASLGSRESKSGSKQGAVAKPCWVIQPNFDVIVYLHRASAPSLSFIERVAERRPSEGATALYRLTRASVYAALESGISPDRLLDTLAGAAEYPLPENVRYTVADWVAHRERVSLYRIANLLEFNEREARDNALAESKLQGVPVGDRFIMFSGKGGINVIGVGARRAIDYLAKPVECLEVFEDGTVRMQGSRADLLIGSELAAWADPVPSGPAANPITELADIKPHLWRLSRSSVQRALSACWTPDTIVENLQRRSHNPLPPLLLVAIHAWAGSPIHSASVAIATDIILQVKDSQLADAIWETAMLQRCLRGRLGPATLRVKPESVEELRRKLEHFGLNPGTDLPLAESQQKNTEQ